MDDLMPPLMNADAMAKYPWVYPPPGFYPIDRNGIKTVGSGVAGSDILETISEVGQGSEGYIRLLALESGDFSTTFFTLIENDQPMKNYVRLEAPIGATSTPRACLIKLLGNNTYKLKATYTAGAQNVALRWTIFGWYYPIKR